MHSLQDDAAGAETVTGLDTEAVSQKTRPELKHSVLQRLKSYYALRRQVKANSVQTIARETGIAPRTIERWWRDAN